MEEEYYLQLNLLKEKALSCPNFQGIIVNNTAHTYSNKEKEIAKLICDWIKMIEQIGEK